MHVKKSIFVTVNNYEKVAKKNTSFGTVLYP